LHQGDNLFQRTLNDDLTNSSYPMSDACSKLLQYLNNENQNMFDTTGSLRKQLQISHMNRLSQCFDYVNAPLYHGVGQNGCLTTQNQMTMAQKAIGDIALNQRTSECYPTLYIHMWVTCD